MHEGELLQHIYARSSGSTGPATDSVIVGPGDDCAVLDFSGTRLLIAADQLIAGRHFDSQTTTPDLIARKAIARNVSDIAAMAGTPTHTLCTAALPDGYPHANELFDRAHTWARHFGCPLVGGDIATTPGPLALSVTILGTEHATRASVLRSGAKVGDNVFVSGPLGASYETGWHLEFQPRVELARRIADELANALHAMIDLSDGLGLDGARIAEASGVGLELQAEEIPVRSGATSWREAVGDGEDYELLVCADAEEIEGMVRIGRVVDGCGCVVVDGDTTHDVSTQGWRHG